MSKPTIPANVYDTFFVEPPPRYTCHSCSHVFHLHKERQPGKGIPWVHGVCMHEVEGKKLVSEAFFILCPKCSCIAIPIVLSKGKDAQELIEEAKNLKPPTEPAKIKVPEAKPAAQPKTLTPADILAGKGRK